VSHRIEDMTSREREVMTDRALERKSIRMTDDGTGEIHARVSITIE